MQDARSSIHARMRRIVSSPAAFEEIMLLRPADAKMQAKAWNFPRWQACGISNPLGTVLDETNEKD